jgi:hypothetical protein
VPRSLLASISLTLILALTLARLASAADPALAASGIVTAYSASDRRFTVADEAGASLTFTWSKDTRFNGVVYRGSKVTVRYVRTSDQENVAQTVGVVK